MNRNNIWIHLTLACLLIVTAAIAGQIERWRSALKQTGVVSRTSVSASHVPDISDKHRSPELIVKFAPNIGIEQIRSVAAAHNDAVVDEIESVRGLMVIDDLDDNDAEADAKEYSSIPGVVYAQPNYRIYLNEPSSPFQLKDLKYRDPAIAGAPNDPYFKEQWALHNLGIDGGTSRADIDAVRAWSRSHGSSDVVVGVIDSGVDLTHEDLRSNNWVRPDNLAPYHDDELGTFDDLYGFNSADKYADPTDDNGHGTHCAGIIGAEGDNGVGVAGVNWHVKILPVKYLNASGTGDTSAAIEAINYLIARKKDGVNIRIINASWGSNEPSPALKDAIQAAGDAGILFVAAAGNDGVSNDDIPHYPSNFDLPNIVSVAAVDRNDRLTTFSNFGARSVHIAAPGKDILSTWPGSTYRTISGTSMAAPFVSGVAALIAAQEPNISVRNLRAKLLNSVDKVSDLKGKVSTGGRICAAKAVGLRD